jgi:hypothetical protein
MATLPAFQSKPEILAALRAPANPPSRFEADPYALRSLPLEDVFLHCKRIDNSRLERTPDLRARGACWSTIGAACVLVALLGTVLVPSVAGTLAGYRLQTLKAEERRLLDEMRVLEAKEAELVSTERLERLAADFELGPPGPGQEIHLRGKGAVAMAK